MNRRMHTVYPAEFKADAERESVIVGVLGSEGETATNTQIPV